MVMKYLGTDSMDHMAMSVVMLKIWEDLVMVIVTISN